MRNLNLIPAKRLQARRRRMHFRWCAAGCVAYALAAAAGSALAWNSWAGSDPAVARLIARADADLQRDQQDLNQVKARLAQQQDRLASARLIAAEPDWGLLMTLLADKCDDQMVLRSCQLRPASDAAADSKSNQAKPSDGLVVVVTGMAKSPQAAQQYVLRLEKTGFFDKVTLVDTRREMFLDGEASAFRVEGMLGSANPAHSPTDSQGRDKP